MSEHNSPPACNGTTKPIHIAYQVREGKGDDRSFWTRIGSAWPHADGKGFNLRLESLPINGRITLRIPTDES